MPRVHLSAASSSTSFSIKPSFCAALIAATERVRSGTFSPGDAHHLLDELLLQAIPVSGRSLDGFLAVLARARPPDACSDGPALAIDLFRRMSRGAGLWVLRPTRHTYAILMDCCCRVRRLDLTLAVFGRLFRTGIGADVVTFSSLLRGLCDAKRTEEAMDMLLHRMPKMGCVPDVVSYNILLKGLFKEGEVAKACDLFLEMLQQGIPPSVVTYNTN